MRAMVSTASIGWKASGTLAAVLSLLLGACSGEPGRLAAGGRAAGGRAAGGAAAGRPVGTPSATSLGAEAPVVYGNGSGSISGAGGAGWTTPPAGGSVQPAPVPITSTWSAPPAPPAPAATPVVSATPYTTVTPPCAPAYVPAPAPCAPAAAPARTWSGCGLPCADGLSMWHVRGVIGEAFFTGTDPAKNCLYWGADVGRTFCGCWGMDLFYRYHGDQFDRQGGTLTKDGGSWNHVGFKVTTEHSFGSSRLYWWAGLGPEYFWTKDYIQDDSGFGVFAEAGIGYVLSENFRVRLGVNAHGMDTNVGRLNPTDDATSRWLFVIAPVAELELDF